MWSHKSKSSDFSWNVPSFQSHTQTSRIPSRLNDGRLGDNSLPNNVDPVSSTIFGFSVHRYLWLWPCWFVFFLHRLLHHLPHRLTHPRGMRANESILNFQFRHYPVIQGNFIQVKLFKGKFIWPQDPTDPRFELRSYHTQSRAVPYCWPPQSRDSAIQPLLEKAWSKNILSPSRNAPTHWSHWEIPSIPDEHV